jgi:hypothetical protein
MDGSNSCSACVLTGINDMKNRQILFFVSAMVQEIIHLYLPDEYTEGQFSLVENYSKSLLKLATFAKVLQAAELSEEMSKDNVLKLKKLMDIDRIGSLFGDEFSFQGLKVLLDNKEFVEPPYHDGVGFNGLIVHDYWKHKKWFDENFE